MIRGALRAMGVDTAADGKLTAFSDLFARWNRRISLSAAVGSEQIAEHILDSLHVVPHLAAAAHVVDVGSGGGFPVVIAAIAIPTIKFVALEPVHKKHAFLRTAVRELGLSNLEPRAERLEYHAAHDYDVAMSRATFDLAEWLSLGSRLVRSGGRVIGFEAGERADLGVVERHRYTLVSGKSRALVIRRRP
jgi:16S rRNA (guanine527-N7)-methyltransferase